MATQEKLLKSLEVLKNLSTPNQTSDTSKKKEKIQHCHVITEAISNASIKIASNFHTYLSITIEVLLQLCDDQESDIRMVAEESLNRIIRAMNDGNIGKVQIELHKGIKKNGSARSLRAALWRFSQLAHLIRPHKGKPYVVNLFPTIMKISERSEEQIHETLANSLPKIMQVLGSFASDNEIKALLKALLINVLHQSGVIRRTTANCILSVILNCRKPYVFITYVINHLLDLLVPVDDSQPSSLILGVMNCLKTILPHARNLGGKQEIKGSFGVTKEVDFVPLAVDRMLQIYELCLYYLGRKDHNVINSALETLSVLLQNCPSELKKILISEGGISKSRIAMPQSSSLSKLRSPSQLSVATNVTSEDIFVESELTETLRTDIEKWIDESKLSVINVTYAKINKENAEKLSLIDSKSTSLDASVADAFDYKINEYIGGVKSHSIGENLERLTLSDNSSEKSFSYVEDDRHLEADVLEISIGSFLDKDIPLVYCARLILKSFLLSGNEGTVIADKVVRVSVKSLALLCFAAIIKLHPKIFLLYLDKNYASAKAKNMSNQQISDVLLYESHPDPQLRGVLRLVLSNFVTAALNENPQSFDSWISTNSQIADQSPLHLDNLVTLLIKGLQDESSSCSRQTLLSLGRVFHKIADSSSCSYILPFLNVLPLTSSNPYWLVKVALCELLSGLPYMTICYVADSTIFQRRIIHNVLFDFLGDDDQRVRTASANAIVNIIPNLYYKEFSVEENMVTAKAVTYKNLYLSNLYDADESPNLTMTQRIKNMPYPFCAINRKKCDQVEFSLSKIINKLYNLVLTSTSKHLTYGCIETLSLLSKNYPTTVYRNAWNCLQAKADSAGLGLDLLNICMSFLKHSVICYDLNCHINLLNLTSNIYAGHVIELLRPVPDEEPSNIQWDMFTNAKFSTISDHYLNHMIKLLNIFHYVLDEAVPVQPQTKAVLSNLAASNTLSPIKRRKSDLERKMLSSGKNQDREDKEKRDLSKSTGAFVHLPHYMRIYEILRSSHSNYKISLESEASEKFLRLLREVLGTFSVLMEVGTLVECQGVAEEILGYFRFTFTLEASATVECVQQLLKCLFGTNLTADAVLFKNESAKYRDAKVPSSENAFGFHYNISQKPYKDISLCFSALKSNHKVECDGDSTIMGYLHRKDVTKTAVASRNSDKVLANYIRLFEPMVIKSLKQYTITSDVTLQCKVLQLLCQLIKLRVNYCLLDSEQIFIGFVLKQFEYIEEGQVPLASELIPRIFEFLVHLSYSKQHSKSIITIPKIIQLCDGLMASGQSPLTHCIPALEPIVQDIFLSRNKSNTHDMKELETTRDVVLSMLLRLSEYHEVIDLIILILDDSKYCSDDPEKWLRWSSQVVSIIFPMLKQNKVRLNCPEAFALMRKLIFALNPSVFTPVDSIVLMMFQEPLNQESSALLYNRWLTKILVALLILSPLKEEVLIAKIDELKAEFSPDTIFENVVTTIDPLNVMNSADIFTGVSSETIFIRFLFKVCLVVSDRCVDIARNEETDFLIEETCCFLMYCLYIFQSGSHCKITNHAICSLNEMQLEAINRNFLRLAPSYPLLTFLWCYILTLLNYNKEFWVDVLKIDNSCDKLTTSLNCKLLTTGCILLFCDFMNENSLQSDHLDWFLDSYIALIINLCEEPPVSEFISSVHRSPPTSKLFLDSIVKHCLTIKDPEFITKLLQSVENTHSNHIGLLLKLLLPKLLVSRQLAISRCVANLASRKIEFLLTMSMEDVNAQLTKEDLLEIIKTLVSLKLIRKHEALSSLLNKLCTQYYDISPLEFDQKRTVNPEYIKKLHINKSWYLSQIKGKYDDVKLGRETAELLTRLDYAELRSFMRDPGFSKSNFKECISLGVNLMKRTNTIEAPPIVQASVDCLLDEVAEICRQYQTTPVPQLLLDELIPSVTCFIDFLPHLPHIQFSSHVAHENIVKFAVITLESTITVNKINPNVNFLHSALSCSDAILKGAEFSSILSLDNNISWLCSAITSLYSLVNHLLVDEEPLPTLPHYGLKAALEDKDCASAGQACYHMYLLVCWLYKIKSACVNIPPFLLKPIKSLIVSMSRLPLVNSYVLIPTRVWKSGWTPDLLGTFHTQVPPLPIELLQEIDILEEFIYRVTLLGWTTRQQFEETWMSLLSVLCNSPAPDMDAAEANDIVHASSLAIKAITSLLLQTLCHPVLGNTNVSNLIHVPRDLPVAAKDISITKLKNIHANIESKHAEFTHLPDLSNVFNRRNFENTSKRYSYGQISVKYLLIATKTITTEDHCEASRIWKIRESSLESCGLDVNSCLQFLLDFYTQLLKQSNTPLRLLYEAVRSTVIISDLFTDKSQFSWMLDMLLELSKSHILEDEVLPQYLIVGICKSAAVLTPDLETYESIKKLLVQYLKSSFLPSRISCLHGLLYILEGCKFSNISIGGVSDELQLILPCAVEYVQCNLNSNHSVLKRSQEHTMLVWALAFFLIENIDEAHMECNFIWTTVQTTFALLMQHKTTLPLQRALMKGLERLVIVKRDIAERINKKVVSLALEKLKSDNPSVSILGQQLLLSYMYTDCSQYFEDVNKSSSSVQTNPDHLVQTIEKVSAIFEHIKKGYAFEVEILCSVLPDILGDFFTPSDILTKVIGEFLSPQQPHPKLLSRVVFQVFKKAIEQQQLPLLQDWVVFSLSNFTQSLSIGMATWCLTCFFISASNNEWLRSFFPYVQTRVGRYEYEDRKMLCIAGTDFYKNLTGEKQKTTFVENFNKIKEQPDSLFNDLLLSL